jgi:VanZ family protein
MLGAMYCFSTEVFTSANTLRVLRAIFGLEEADESHQTTLRHANFLIRKTAHVMEYAILTALIYFAVRRGRAERWRWTWAFAALGFAVACAALDEWHQAFSPGRTSKLADVLLDGGGAVLALALIALRARLRTR